MIKIKEYIKKNGWRLGKKHEIVKDYGKVHVMNFFTKDKIVVVEKDIIKNRITYSADVSNYENLELVEAFRNIRSQSEIIKKIDKVL